MHVGEIIAAAIVGALLLGVGYELGRSAHPAGDAQAETFDRAALESEIQVSVEAEVARQQDELAECLIAQVEEFLPKLVRHEPEIEPEAEPGGLQAESESARRRQLEKELDELLSGGLAGLEPERVAKPVSNEDVKRRREIFSPAQLREYEEARRQMLEERRRLREKEEKRRK